MLGGILSVKETFEEETPRAWPRSSPGPVGSASKGAGLPTIPGEDDNDLTVSESQAWAEQCETPARGISRAAPASAGKPGPSGSLSALDAPVLTAGETPSPTGASEGNRDAAVSRLPAAPSPILVPDTQESFWVPGSLSEDEKKAINEADQTNLRLPRPTRLPEICSEPRCLPPNRPGN